MIFNQNDEANEFFVVLRGSCEVIYVSARGERNKLADIYPGGSFGELGLKTKEVGYRRAGVVSVEPTELLYMTKKNYNSCLSGYRDLMAEHTYQFLRKVPGFQQVDEVKIRQLSYVLNFYKVPAGIVKNFFLNRGVLAVV